MSKPKRTGRRRQAVKAAGEQSALDQPSYSQDPQVHKPSMAPEPAPVPAPPSAAAPTKPKADVSTSPKVEPPHEDVLSQPLKYVVSSEDAIEKVETLLRLVKESRPDLQQQVDTVLQQIENLEKGAWGQEFQNHEGQEQPGLVFSPGDPVQVETEGQTYNGTLLDQNEDGTWEVLTDQNMTLSNVPASSLQAADQGSAAAMSLPASQKTAAQRLQAGLSAMQALLTAFVEGKTVTEMLKDKSPEEVRELVTNWKQRLDEVGEVIESPEFLHNAIAEAEALLPQEDRMVKAEIKRLPSGRWKDTNGNSYDSREDAAEAEAHSHVDPKLDPESDEYKAQHAAAMEEILAKSKAKAGIKADFMEKQVFEADGVDVETTSESFHMPWDKSKDGEPTAENVAKLIGAGAEEVKNVTPVHGWFGRFSAPGYLDATDWVFADTQEACDAELERLYGLGEETDEVKANKKKLRARLKLKPEALRALLDKTKSPTVVTAGAEPAAAPTAQEVLASAFDEIKELELGNGWILRRKKGGEKKAEKKDEGAEPKPAAEPKDKKDEPKPGAAPVEAGLQAADDKDKKDDKKFDGPMIEVVNPEGKVVDTLPDAFGTDTVAIIKLFQQLYDTEKGEKKGDDKDKKDEPKGESDDKNKDEGKDKSKDKKDESLEDKPRALPAGPMVQVTKDEEKELEAARQMLEQRVHQVRGMVKVLVDKNYVVADQKDIDEILLTQAKGKESLTAAMDAALSRAADREFKKLLAMPDTELMLLKASLPNLQARATQIKVQASMEGLDSVDSLAVRAQKIAQHGSYSVGDAFAFGGRLR